MSLSKKLLNIILTPLLIIGTVLLVILMIQQRKPRPSRHPGTAVPIVDILISNPATHSTTIQTFGNVRAYHQTRLASLIGGQIISIEPRFEVGRAVNEGELLLTIDPADFQAAVSERQGTLAAAKQLLAEENARSQLAQDDWIATGRKLEDAPDFTLRKPQLAAAEASLIAAEATLDRARLDLQRTALCAPFDAIVSTRNASPGNIVSVGAELGILIARHRVDVRLPLTPEQAKLIDLPLAFDPQTPTQTITATLSTPIRPGKTWTAKITRTESGVDPRNQVLYLIAEVSHPFRSADDFLPIGTFVEARLPARPAPDTHRLPLSALVEDQFVWTVDEHQKLVQQPITRISSRDGYFLGITPKDSPPPKPMRVITLPLVSFGEGSPVKLSAKQAEGSDPP